MQADTAACHRQSELSARDFKQAWCITCVNHRLSLTHENPSVAKKPQSVVAISRGSFASVWVRQMGSPNQQLRYGVSNAAESFLPANMLQNSTSCRLAGLIRVIARIRIEHGRVEPLIDGHRIEEPLAGHVSVEIAGDVIGRHDPGNRPIVLVDFFFQIFLSIHRVAPLERLLYR